MSETPWIAGPIAIRRDVLDAIRAHAIESYPSECCGLATGPATDASLVDAASRETNEADKYHRLDPEQFPRTSREYFKINELRAQKAFIRGREGGQPVKLIYHSHCDAGDYFSAEDAATFAQEGQLTWPCAYLVVSVREGVAISQRVWVHVPGTNDFREAELCIV
ncbi:MAG: Mov34/MPN/PAD-1 family protein [Deltaproteobacteria bacterium]|nr:Mov34/MPN/PAD-1 family protein [Deltaproteobacteria bacterium]